MKAGWLIALSLVARAANAEPPNMSQNPRGGLLAEIDFAAGSTRLPDAGASQLGRVAAWALENFDGLVVLDGHADRDGDIRLSWRRAQLVRDQLVALGVDPDQIIVSAFGAEKRRRARVTVWGTRNSLESMIAARQHADMLMWSRQSQPQVRSRSVPRGRARSSR